MPHKRQSRMLLVNEEERLDMLDKWRAVEKKQIRDQIRLHSTVCLLKGKYHENLLSFQNQKMFDCQQKQRNNCQVC